jgi:hypothetical protein
MDESSSNKALDKRNKDTTSGALGAMISKGDNVSLQDRN